MCHVVNRRDSTFRAQRERETERDRERERETERQRERERQTERDRETERQTETGTHTHAHMHTDLSRGLCKVLVQDIRAVCPQGKHAWAAHGSVMGRRRGKCKSRSASDCQSRKRKRRSVCMCVCASVTVPTLCSCHDPSPAHTHAHTHTRTRTHTRTHAHAHTHTTHTHTHTRHTQTNGPASVQTFLRSAPLKPSPSLATASKSMSPLVVMAFAWIFRISSRACSFGSGISVVVGMRVKRDGAHCEGTPAVAAARRRRSKTNHD